eukprot:TRINITY_DN7842_c1_g1_i1.p1 TRINITY_DN7842_c1_g1~~TRINITY_DN7842_c1_g1_i1.p1  ORF type:complete len:288 (-),score=80.86 TRINITY_DN7842_c1_g1_i1:131-940(-)
MSSNVSEPPSKRQCLGDGKDKGEDLMDSAALEAAREQLVSARSSGDIAALHRELKKLETCVPLLAGLASSGIGRLLGELQKEPAVADVAGRVVARWKALAVAQGAQTGSANSKAPRENESNENVDPATVQETKDHDFEKELSPYEAHHRNSMVHRIFSALGGNSAGPSAVSAALEIERQLFMRFVGDALRHKLLALQGALQNPENRRLRRRVLSGRLPARVLVQMRAGDLLPEAVQRGRQALRDQHLREAVEDDAPGAAFVLRPMHVGR